MNLVVTQQRPAQRAGMSFDGHVRKFRLESRELERVERFIEPTSDTTPGVWIFGKVAALGVVASALLYGVVYLLAR